MTDNIKNTLRNKYRGCLLGLAAGDALGTTLEFKSPGSFLPLTDMVGGGPFRLDPGYWTDDTSMALCLAESLIKTRQFDAKDQIERYLRWYRQGHWSSTGRCFDIGNTTRTTLEQFEQGGDPLNGSTDEWSAANGSIMRLAPVPLAFAHDPETGIRLSGQSSKTTHRLKICIDACRYMGAVLVGAVNGETKEVLLSDHYRSDRMGWNTDPLDPKIAEIASGSFKHKQPPQISGTGYVADCLESALWAFYNSDTFEQGCLMAVNLGNDADTTGAVYGQIAGAYYGMDGANGIPGHWQEKIFQRQSIIQFADNLLQMAAIPGGQF